MLQARQTQSLPFGARGTEDAGDVWKPWMLNWECRLIAEYLPAMYKILHQGQVKKQPDCYVEYKSVKLLRHGSRDGLEVAQWVKALDELACGPELESQAPT